MQATRVRFGPAPQKSRRRKHGPVALGVSSPTARSRGAGQQLSDGRQDHDSQPAEYKRPTLPYLSQMHMPGLDDLPPLQQRVRYPAPLSTSPRSPTRAPGDISSSPLSLSPVSAQMHQYRRFVSTPSNSDLHTVLQSALADLYEHRPADDLLHLVFFLRNAIRERDGLEDADALEQQEVQRLKAENRQLKTMLSSPAKDMTQLNQMLSTELQKTRIRLREAQTEIAKLTNDLDEVKKDIKQVEEQHDATAVELTKEKWLHDLTADEIEVSLRFLFESADADGNGVISPQEFRDLLLDSTLSVSDDEIEYLIQVTDTDENGTIDYNEFVPTAYHLLARFHVQKQRQEKRRARRQNQRKASKEKKLARQQEKDDKFAQEFLLNQLSEEELENKLRSIYVAADADSNGRISVDELFELLASVDGLPEFSMEGCHQLMQEIAGEGNDSSSVEFEQFLPVAFTVLKRIFLNEVKSAREEAHPPSGPPPGAGKRGPPSRDKSAVQDAMEGGLDLQAVEELSSETHQQAELLLQTMAADELEQLLTETFQGSDVDGSGSITPQELKEVLKAAPGLGAFATDEVVKLIVAELDTNRDGNLQFSEFVPLAHEILTSFVADELERANSPNSLSAGDSAGEDNSAGDSGAGATEVAATNAEAVSDADIVPDAASGQQDRPDPQVESAAQTNDDRGEAAESVAQTGGPTNEDVGDGEATESGAQTGSPEVEGESAAKTNEDVGDGEAKESSQAGGPEAEVEAAATDDTVPEQAKDTSLEQGAGQVAQEGVVDKLGDQAAAGEAQAAADQAAASESTEE